jgi:uncharacterized protein
MPPMPTPPRLPALDVLRGVAVMGILVMNIAGFGLPQAAYLNPAAYGGMAGADLAAWAFGFILVDGKMRALFSLLFGAGMLLVIDRAEAAGQDGSIVHLRRMAALLAIGIVHAYLVWSGDILIPYAIVGTLALAHVRSGIRVQVTVALVLLVAQWLLLRGLLGGLDVTQGAANAPDASQAAVDAWRSINNQIGIPDAEALRRELATFRGGYEGILRERINHAAGPLLQLIDVGLETLALMLLGMAGLRSGFLAGDWPTAAYRRTALIAYGIGLPALAWIAMATVRSHFDAVTTVQAATLYAAPFRLLVTFGHASALLLWVKQGTGGWWMARIAATGRAAFSNYLATSFVMTGLFYGYGFGLFGRLSRAELYAIVPVAWLAMLGWSKPWLDRYRFGPLEWLWRSLARGQLQPMRRT